MFKKFKFDSLLSCFNYIKTGDLKSFDEVIVFIQNNKLFDIDKIDISILYSYFRDYKKGELDHVEKNNINNTNGSSDWSNFAS